MLAEPTRTNCASSQGLQSREIRPACEAHFCDEALVMHLQGKRR